MNPSGQPVHGRGYRVLDLAVPELFESGSVRMTIPSGSTRYPALPSARSAARHVGEQGAGGVVDVVDAGDVEDGDVEAVAFAVDRAHHLLGAGEKQVAVRLVDADVVARPVHGPQGGPRIARHRQEVQAQLFGKAAAQANSPHTVAFLVQQR